MKAGGNNPSIKYFYRFYFFYICTVQACSGCSLPLALCHSAALHLLTYIKSTSLFTDLLAGDTDSGCFNGTFSAMLCAEMRLVKGTGSVHLWFCTCE